MRPFLSEEAGHASFLCMHPSGGPSSLVCHEVDLLCGPDFFVGFSLPLEVLTASSRLLLAHSFSLSSIAFCGGKTTSVIPLLALGTSWIQ